MDLKKSAFRAWVRLLWIDNCEERLTHGEDPDSIEKYWNTYKYWLKREYKCQQGKK